MAVGAGVGAGHRVVEGDALALGVFFAGEPVDELGAHAGFAFGYAAGFAFYDAFGLAAGFALRFAYGYAFG